MFGFGKKKKEENVNLEEPHVPKGMKETAERADPEKIFANAKARIAETAGVTVRDVEHIIKQYTKMKQQMAMIQRMGGMEAVMERMKQGGGEPGAK